MLNLVFSFLWLYACYLLADDLDGKWRRDSDE